MQGLENQLNNKQNHLLQSFMVPLHNSTQHLHKSDNVTQKKSVVGITQE